VPGQGASDVAVGKYGRPHIVDHIGKIFWPTCKDKDYAEESSRAELDMNEGEIRGTVAAKLRVMEREKKQNEEKMRREQEELKRTSDRMIEEFRKSMARQIKDSNGGQQKKD